MFCVCFQGMKEGWEDFNSDMNAYYGVDLSCLTEGFDKEQKDYYIDAAAWQDVHPSQLVGQPMCFKSYDLNKVDIAEIQVFCPQLQCIPTRPCICRMKIALSIALGNPCPGYHPCPVHPPRNGARPRRWFVLLV